MRDAESSRTAPRAFESGGKGMSGTAAIIGGGVIGGGWAARFLLMGWDVRVFDPDPEAERKIGEVLASARLALPGLHDLRLPDEGALSFHDGIADAADGAAYIQESVPERLDLKREVYEAAQERSDPDAVIGSSTSGFKPSELQDCAPRPGRILVAHPFNPVYLLPLVEIVATDRNPPDAVARAQEILTGIGMHPLKLEREIDAHVADRLLEAVWREALWMIKDGIASTEEIDDAIRLGFGLRWAQMGLFETYRIAGGESGMRHFIAQFAPALKWPWTRLTDVPELDAALVDRIAEQSDAQSGSRSIRELERVRDANLVAIMRALKERNWGAGATLKAQDRRISALKGLACGLERADDPSRPIPTLDRAVPIDWTGPDRRMNEAKYLQAFRDATERFMEIVGCVETDGDYFADETFIRHFSELRAGARMRAETICLGNEGGKARLLHSLYEGERLAATCEQLLVHGCRETRRPKPPPESIFRRLSAIAEAQASLPRPETADRMVAGRLRTGRS